MGVHGLWRLIEPSGKPVPLETLENQTLAVDVSIWLHQAIKGFQDSKGASLPNAHLLGIYHRVCKLLYFKIKPVFVFDGGVPVLKKQTIAKRNQLKSRNLSEADRLQQQLLSTLLKHTALKNVISEKLQAVAPSKNLAATTKEKEDMFKLPPSQLDSSISEEEEDSSFVTTSTSDSSPTKHWDVHNIDMQSAHFKSLPIDIRHEILTDLKATRKQNSWGRLHELPKQSDDFSVYQMNRLLKRQAVQTALEDAEKQMGGHSLSLAELESLLHDQGVITSIEKGERIASDENKRFLYIKDVKQAIEEARKTQSLEAVAEECEISSTSNIGASHPDSTERKAKSKADEEYETQLEEAIALSLREEPSTSKNPEAISSSQYSEPSTSSQSQEEPTSSSKYSDEPSTSSSQSDVPSTSSQADDLELAVQLSLQDKPKTKPSRFSFLESFTDADFASESSEDDLEVVEDPKSSLTPAQNYMKEYSGLTPSEIAKIIGDNKPIMSAASKLRAKMPPKKPVEEVATISESESSDDFVEVEDEAIEVVIEPTASIEDDLFSDIFTNKEEIVFPNKQVRFEEVPQIHIISNNEEIESPKPVEETPTKTVAPNQEIEPPKSPTKIPEIPKPKLSVDEMLVLQNELEKEESELQINKATKERLAGNISEQMYAEAQELLELFGVPYITAPMEAEAQCAFLEEINLTNGTITDDSDIWLFGGKTVYKNFFNQTKTVMQFKAEDIQHHFKLTREQMILLAMLVGSDYTTGIQGVGPVTALEILAAFPPPKNAPASLNYHEIIVTGLMEFRKWFQKGKGPGLGRTTLKSKLKNVSFTENFPSLQVVQAYLDPKVEKSRDAFSWGKPDVPGLIEFAKQKFGWHQRKTEEIIKPIVKRLEDHNVQKKIKDYFKAHSKVDNRDLEPQMSKRIKTAVGRIGKDPKEIQAEEDAMRKKARKRKPKENGDAAAKVKEKRVRKTAKKVEVVPAGLEKDEEVLLLQKISEDSAKRVEEINEEARKELEPKKKRVVNLHKKEVIPQRERDKKDLLKSKLKAIELFRKSKLGPGFVAKRTKSRLVEKEDAELSESGSSSSD